ncbi:cobalamin synthesis G-like protein [Mycoplana dimorpha]|uniref:Cobalamin synthesis G-like protein n=2 Tax=Mycoplana dimorpha TaxID=28320 RepID=A0A2T5B8R9_MYCDI|nr:cobalamin synthesis G-like protein [Mycoplana dimorpha]
MRPTRNGARIGAVETGVPAPRMSGKRGQQMRQPAHASEGQRPSIVLGLGCERGAAAAEVIALAGAALRAAGCSADALALVASLDTRAEEPAILAAACHFSVPLRTYDAATLEAETPRLANPSEVVFRHTGCHGVAEASALAAVGPQGRLVVAKLKSDHATAAIAESFQAVAAGCSPIESGASVGSQVRREA